MPITCVFYVINVSETMCSCLLVLTFYVISVRRRPLVMLSGHSAPLRVLVIFFREGHA